MFGDNPRRLHTLPRPMIEGTIFTVRYSLFCGYLIVHVIGFRNSVTFILAFNYSLGKSYSQPVDPR